MRLFFFGATRHVLCLRPKQSVQSCEPTRRVNDLSPKCPKQLKATWSNFNTDKHGQTQVNKEKETVGIVNVRVVNAFFFTILNPFPQLHNFSFANASFWRFWSPSGVFLSTLEASTAILPQVFISLGQAAGMVLTSNLKSSGFTAPRSNLHLSYLSDWIVNFSRDHLVWNHLRWEDMRPLIHSY